MKSKFNFHIAVPEIEWDRELDPTSIAKNGCTDIDYSFSAFIQIL